MLPKTSKSTVLADLKRWFGPPPVLSSENQQAYTEITERLVEAYMPEDILEMMLIRQLVDSNWEIVRCTRHKPLAVDRKLLEQREFQVKRARKLAELREARTRERAERNSQPATQLDRINELIDKVETSVLDVDKILDQPPVELDHARAMEEAFGYLERLDRQITIAIARRNNALELLDLYRDGLGTRLREASARMIEREVGGVYEAFVPEGDPIAAILAEEFEAVPSIEAQAAELPQQPSGEGIPIAAPQASPPDGLHTGGPSQAASEGTR